MDAPVAYQGKEPYIFISYAHKNADAVLHLVGCLQSRGFRIWYDAGIEAGTEWPEYIAEHLSGSACVVAFVTKEFVASWNCKREITFAQELDKPVLSIYLEDVEMPMGLRMQLGSNQSVFRSRHKSEESFLSALMAAGILKDANNIREFDIEGHVLKAYHGKDPAATVPEGVEIIGEKAFADSDSLMEVRFPGSLRKIGAGAFEGCRVLKEVTVMDGLETIEEGAFSQCVVLERIHIPDSVKSIGKTAFGDCEGLLEIAFPDGLDMLADGVMVGCRKLEKVFIPNSVTQIGGSAFCGCEKLKEIQIPGSVTRIGWLAFNHCESLREITVPSGVKKIARGTFHRCIELRRVVLEEGVEVIENNAFEQCTRLKDVVLPDSLREICDEAFKTCEALQTIRIPPNVTWIGTQVFYGCESLETLILCKRAGAKIKEKVLKGKALQRVLQPLF
ncbi:MAG: TIR domain-containing protein [Ruminococcaceae bacterium]|nr:TIR domain-containing protein [Oscillospiraceae bacterium]